MLAGFYVAYVLIRAYLNPAHGAGARRSRRTPTGEKLQLLKGLILPILVVIGVLGSIYGGIASVTEASAVGVMGVTLSTMIRGEFTLSADEGRGAADAADRRHDRLDRHRRLGAGRACST